MADSYACKGGRKTAGSNKPAASKESRTETRINPPAELPKLGNATSDKTEGRKKGRPKAENQALKDIPLPLMNQWKDEFKAHSRVKCPNSGCWLEFPSIYGLKYHYQRCQGGAISEKLTYSCSYCEAAFTSKTQLEKHRLWNHLDRPVPTSKAENKVPKAIGKSSGKKRAAESSACPTIHPKQAKTEKAVAQDHAENGECPAESRESKEFQIAAAEAMAAATPTAKSSSGKDTVQQGGSQASLQEEDPERMKHRRKQKTPKKFTGEQPSISGTFGLKGLVKAEDKAKAHRAKKLEGSTNTEELKKKPPGAGVKKETAVHLPAANPEDQWQREISEKGEVSCPTCSVITRKTVVGLKKHMDVCQKLQDALKCQHCKKQFKSKAGLNYHTMAEHVSKGCVANFSSLMGYQYHQKRCGKQLAEADKPVFSCPHCAKKYKSKAGHDYHVRSEHMASVSPPDASAARGAGPSPPGSDSGAAEPVGRTEPGRAGPGKAGADIGPMFFFSPSQHHACVLGGKWATAPSTPLKKQDAAFIRAERSAAFPFLGVHGAVLQPSPHPCSAGNKTRAPQAPAACQRWGGRIHPWGASFSVLLIPTDSASSPNNSLTLINGDVYTRGSVERMQSV
uniref:Zinc finger protein 512B n=1 Tax=Calidris pygmaea TaxID=425635 RepID=A0A8C3JFM9_9CHAR